MSRDNAASATKHRLFINFNRSVEKFELEAMADAKREDHKVSKGWQFICHKEPNRNRAFANHVHDRRVLLPR
jgi:hypothetical protein